jgi:hypothetical protein
MEKKEFSNKHEVEIQPQINKDEIQPQINKDEIQPPINKDEIQPPINKDEIQPQINKDEIQSDDEDFDNDSNYVDYPTKKISKFEEFCDFLEKL